MQNHVPPKSSDLEKFHKKQESKKIKNLSTATPATQQGHIGEILSIDITEDETILASGGKDKLIGVWDLTDSQSSKWKAGLRGHKDIISVGLGCLK
jgi:ribosomal RNA-processing protein 9